MTYMKSGSPLLYDEDTGDVVGVKDTDGGESMFVFTSTDASGNTVLSVGAYDLPLPEYSGNTCVIIGDSLTGQNHSVAGAGGEGKAYNPTNAYFSRTQDKGYMSWLQVISGNAFIPLYNGGASGEKTPQILARVPTVLAYSPKWVFEMSGTNDVGALVASYGGDGTLCENAIYDNRLAMWAAFKASGAKVVAFSIPPDATTGANHTAAEMGVICRVNRRLRNYALANGIFWVDSQKALADPANTAGHGPDTYFDGTVLHFGPWGAYRLAVEAWAQVQNHVKPYAGLVSSQGDFYGVDTLSKNLLPPIDGMMQNGTNTTAQTGTSGTFPAASGSNAFLMSRTAGAAATAVISVQADPDAVGNSVKAVITSTADGDEFRMLWADGSPSITELPAGTPVYFECGIKCTGMTNLRSLNGKIIVTTTGGAAAATYESMALENSGQTGITDATGFTGVLRTPVIIVPADATGITLLRAGLVPKFSGAGGATIEMWRMAIVKAD